jgi:hypothetical protein
VFKATIEKKEVVDAAFSENPLLSSFTQTNITIHQGEKATHQASKTIFKGNEHMFPWFPIKTIIIKLLIRVYADKEREK